MTQPSDTQMIEGLSTLLKATEVGHWSSSGFPDGDLVSNTMNFLPRLLELARLGVKAQGLMDALHDLEYYCEHDDPLDGDWCDCSSVMMVKARKAIASFDESAGG